MNPILLPEVQQFIRDHEHDDERALVLKTKTIAGIASAVIAQQIAGRRKAKDKIPTFYNTPIIYPPGLNLEQSSSEATANFKTEVIRMLNIPKEKGVDLTGGFGVDSFFMSRVFRKFDYIERDPDLFKITTQNHQTLKADNIIHLNVGAEEYLTTSENTADFVFIDPSRRDENLRKVFRFSDGSPDIVALQNDIFHRASHLMVKASPLLDITLALQDLKNVTDIFIVSANNECKELLFVSQRLVPSREPRFHAINLKKDARESFSFLRSEEQNAVVRFSSPLRYLYEPNSSLMKAGAFKIVGEKSDLCKLHVSTHLYTADTLHEHFPGRIFEVQEMLKSDVKIIQRAFPRQKANIIVRNYPMTPEALKSKFRLKDGGESYLLAFSAGDEKMLSRCTRLK